MYAASAPPPNESRTCARGPRVAAVGRSDRGHDISLAGVRALGVRRRIPRNRRGRDVDERRKKKTPPKRARPKIIMKIVVVDRSSIACATIIFGAYARTTLVDRGARTECPGAIVTCARARARMLTLSFFHEAAKLPGAGAARTAGGLLRARSICH